MQGKHEISEARSSAAAAWPSIAIASSQLCRAGPRALARTRVERAPTLSLGTIFVAGELVVVSGSVSAEAAATAELEVNGYRVAIDAGGSFCASVLLAGEPALTLFLETQASETITMHIPLRASAVRGHLRHPGAGPPPKRLRLVSA